LHAQFCAAVSEILLNIPFLDKGHWYSNAWWRPGKVLVWSEALIAKGEKEEAMHLLRAYTHNNSRADDLMPPREQLCSVIYTDMC
jgi:hypothetical protein